MGILNRFSSCQEVILVQLPELGQVGLEIVRMDKERAMSSAGMDPDTLQPNGVLNNLRLSSKCDSLETQMLKSGIRMSMSMVPPSCGSDSESDCRRGED